MKAILLLTLVAAVIAKDNLPNVLFHGLHSACADDIHKQTVDMVQEGTGAYTKCMELFSPSPKLFSDVFNIWRQGRYACSRIKSDPELKDGFNLIGTSQGGIISRYIVQFCEDRPPVNKLVTIGTPHAGVSMTPYCGDYWFCLLLDWGINRVAYYSFVQKYLAPTNYW